MSRPYRFKRRRVIAIDGPSGAGKSTVARMLARELGYLHLDTGAMYRAVAIAARRAGIGYDDAKGLDKVCGSMNIRLLGGHDGIRVILNGEDVTEEIRLPETSLGSSSVSAVPEVRRHMVRLQREMGGKGCVVAEGRDMGSVVFPESDAKFYLDADPEERVRRRWMELKDRGVEGSIEDVREGMEKRDRNDSTRSYSPLKVSSDAYYLDTTGMTPEQVVMNIVGRIRELEADGR